MKEVPGSIERAERRRPGLDKLSARLGEIGERSEKLGIAFSGVVTTADMVPVFRYYEDNLTFAASIGKLPLALMVVEQLAPERESDLAAQGLDVAELIEAMLGRSDNGAYRALAELMEGPEAINQYMATKWRHSRVVRASNGRTQIGDTTPLEALMQFRELISADDGNRDLKNAAIGALRDGEVTNHGIRQVLSGPQKSIILDKTGEYNGDEDTDSVRNNTGLVVGVNRYPTLLYSFMSSGRPGKAYGWIEDKIIALATAEVLEATGNGKALSLGRRAVKASRRLFR